MDVEMPFTDRLMSQVNVETEPSQIEDSKYLVVGKVVPQAVRKIFIEQDLNATGCLRIAWANCISRSI